MKKTLYTIAVLGCMASSAVSADKFSFPHAAELTSQAKTIVWQEVRSEEHTSELQSLA